MSLLPLVTIIRAVATEPTGVSMYVRYSYRLQSYLAWLITWYK